MRLVTHRFKRRFVHLNTPPDPLMRVKCGAWTFEDGYYLDEWQVEELTAESANRLHYCRKCFPK